MKRQIFYSFILIFLLIGLSGKVEKVHAAEGIELHTPYTGVAVTPGETINYTLELMNNTPSIQHVKIALADLNKDWDRTITSGGWALKEISIKPGESEELTIDLTVPLQIEKGDYPFKIVATSESGLKAELPMSITVSEEGTFKTEFTTDQPNLEGHSDSSFDYTAELKNRTANEQHYALMAAPPKGWTVDFKADGKSVTSVVLESNGSKTITVNVTPPAEVQSESYEIPIRATNETTSADLILEAVISGTYGIDITTPNGKLSEDVVAGGKENIDIIVKNTGSTPLNNIKLESTNPEGWNVKFEPSSINQLEPGKSQTIKASVEANKNAIAGDYVVEINANSDEASSKAQFRISVKTSMLWGWVSILIIVIVIGGIFYLVRKYGRR